MKLFILAIAIISIQAELSPAETEKIKKISEECQAESGADQKILEKVAAGSFESDAKLSNHLLCVGKKLEIIDDTGKIKEDSLKTRAKLLLEDDKVVDDVVKKCAQQIGKPEEVALNLFKCVYDTAHISL